jgi:hypothetical protein
MGLGDRSLTCCKVGRCEVSGQSDGEGRRWRGAARLMARKKKPWVCETHGRKNKKKKQTVGLRDPRPEKQEKKKKQTVGLRDPRLEKQGKKKKQTVGLSAGKMARPLRDPFLISSFFFLFSFFLVENLVLLGVEFFCAFFSL